MVCKRTRACFPWDPGGELLGALRSAKISSSLGYTEFFRKNDTTFGGTVLLSGEPNRTGITVPFEHFHVHFIGLVRQYERFYIKQSQDCKLTRFFTLKISGVTDRAARRTSCSVGWNRAGWELNTLDG